MKSIALLVAALGCTACTSLKVHEFNPALPASRVGIPYPLGFTQYKIELTRRVIACGNEMKVAAAAKIEETRNAPDPQRRYVIDPNSLGSMVKTSDVKLEYHPNGLVGALNASAVDKTGDIIANVGTTAVKIASLAAAAGGPAGACKPEVVQALADVEAQQAKVATANDVLERSLARMKRAREKVEALGAATDESAKAEASKAYDELIVSTSRQKAETEKLDALLAKITYKQVVRWPENGDVGRGVYRMDPDVLANWALNLSGDPLNPARAQLDIFIQLETVSSDGRPLPLVRPGDSAAPPTGSGIDEKIDPALGIPFRQPGYGELKICNINFCDRGGEVLATQAGSALQLGQIYYLPCRSRPFTSVECKFELTEDGWLKSMGTSNKEADQLLVTARDIGRERSHERQAADDTGGDAQRTRETLRCRHRDRRDRRKYRDVRELPHIIHAVERRIELFANQHGDAGEQGGEQESHDEQPKAVWRVGPHRGDRRLENPKTFALIRGFHALGELGILVAFEQRVVEFFGRLTVPHDQRELVLAIRNLLEAVFGRGDQLAETLILQLEPVDLGVESFERARAGSWLAGS